MSGLAASQAGCWKVTVLTVKNLAMTGLYAVLAAFSAGVAAQGAAVAVAVVPAADAGAAAAMARAERAASNPMRVILEASRVKRRSPEAETADTGAVEASRKASAKPPIVATPGAVKPAGVALASAAAPAVIRLAAGEAPAAVNILPASAAESPRAALPIGAPPASLVSSTATGPAAGTAASTAAITLPLPLELVSATAVAKPAAAALVVPLPEPATVLPLTDVRVTPAAQAVASALLTRPLGLDQSTSAPTVGAEALSKPRMLNMVEPIVPARVLQQVGRIGEVLVDLALRRDGTVASVTLLPSAPRQIQRYVVEALEKWRYAPLEQDTVHRVQLVFNVEP